MKVFPEHANSNIKQYSILIITLVFWSLLSHAQNNVGINDNNSSPEASSMLDVYSTTKGMLIPRVSLTATTIAAPVTNPATSLLVYNTATTADVTPGFYYWNGTIWVTFIIQPATIGLFAFADFYALNPSDNSATIAAGSAIAFPNAGPTSGSTIIAISSTQFQLSNIGTYMVSWQASIDEAGQLVLELNGTELLNTLVGRATGTSQLSGNRIITTSITNSVLRVVNPIGNAVVLTITSSAGGLKPVSASLVITRIQ